MQQLQEFAKEKQGKLNDAEQKLEHILNVLFDPLSTYATVRTSQFDQKWTHEKHTRLAWHKIIDHVDKSWQKARLHNS